MHRVTEHPGQRRLERKRTVAIKRHVGDAKPRRKLEFRCQRGECAIGAVELEPAAMAQIALRAGFGGKFLVFGDRAREQRPHQPRSLDQPLRLRGGAKRRQPGRDPRQIRQVIVGDRRAFERDARKLDQARRKRRRKNGIALDDAGIAVGGALARPAAVDQRDRQAALDEMDRDRGADDAGAEHDDIGARQESLRCGVTSIVCAGGGRTTRPGRY